MNSKIGITLAGLALALMVSAQDTTTATYAQALDHHGLVRGSYPLQKNMTALKHGMIEDSSTEVSTDHVSTTTLSTTKDACTPNIITSWVPTATATVVVGNHITETSAGEPQDTTYPVAPTGSGFFTFAAPNSTSVTRGPVPIPSIHVEGEEDMVSQASRGVALAFGTVFATAIIAVFVSFGVAGVLYAIFGVVL